MESERKLSSGTFFAVEKLVTALEISIIYFSIGAPFGVLAFFGGNGFSRLRLTANTSVAVLIWPILLFFRIRGSLARRTPVADVSADRFGKVDELMEMVDGTFSRKERRLLEDHFYLFASASDSKNAGYEEYLELAGNAHPRTGAACLARQRSRQIARRLETSRNELVRELKNSEGSFLTGASKVYELCKLLDDSETAIRLQDDSRSTSLSEISRPSEAVIVN